MKLTIRLNIRYTRQIIWRSGEQKSRTATSYVGSNVGEQSPNVDRTLTDTGRLLFYK